MKVCSRVYQQQSIKFNSGVAKFVNGVAEISEELYNEIVERKFPEIYPEGQLPSYKTKLEDQLISEVKEGNQEFLDEIKRLKDIITSLKTEVAKKDQEIAEWKSTVDKIHEQYRKNPLEEITKKAKLEKAESEEDEKEILRKDLAAMKVAELKELAMSEDGGSYKEEDLANKKKEEIIDMIIAKA